MAAAYACVELLDGASHARYWSEAFTAADADRLLAALLTEPDWRHEEITVVGRRVRQPRLSAWQGDPGATYTYSGLTLAPEPWSTSVLEVKAAAERLAGARFNSVLLNLYRDGRDSMGWHADDEPELGPEPVIASVSFGASRRFLLRRRSDAGDREEVALGHGSVLVMEGRTQHEWLHSVPKTARPVAPRVNLTFRSIVR